LSTNRNHFTTVDVPVGHSLNDLLTVTPAPPGEGRVHGAKRYIYIYSIAWDMKIATLFTGIGGLDLG